MVDMPLPPFAEPAGPRVDDTNVLTAFAEDARQIGHSPWFHVEGPTLLASGDAPVALRIGRGTVLVRLDLPDDLAWVRGPVEEALRATAMSCLDADTLLAAPVALQVLGLRLSNWDLWGTDLDDAFAALRVGAVGEQFLPMVGADDGLGPDAFNWRPGQ